MTAKFVDLNGETLALILQQPNRATNPQISLELPAEVTKHPLSKRESRRAHAKTLRYSMQHADYFRSADDALEFRIWLNQQKTQTIATPLWVDVCRLTSPANAGATVLHVDNHPVRWGEEWIVVDLASGLYEFIDVEAVAANQVTAAAPGLVNNWPAGTTIYPLVFCRLDDRPQLEALTASRAATQLKLKESSAYERRLNQFPIAIATVGPQIPNKSTLPLWTLQPNFVRVLDRTEADVTFDLVGFGREERAIAYSTPNRRPLEMEFLCRNRDEIAWLETMFATLKGTVGTFMIPTFRNDLELTADLPVGGNAKRIYIRLGEYSDEGRTPHPGDPYIAIVDPVDPMQSQIGQTTIDPHKIDIVAGTDLTTNQDVTRTHKAATARVSFLQLVRLVEPQLTWEYITDVRARCRLRGLELPNEYEFPSPALIEEAWLFLWEEVKRYSKLTRTTSYEKELTIPAGDYAGTYAPVHISAKTLRKTRDLPSQKLDITTGSFDGNPLAKFFPWRLEGQLKLTVLTVNVNDLAAAPKVRFSGYVTEPSPALTDASVKPFGKLLDRQIPCHILSVVDNYDLGDAQLGVDIDDYKITGPIASIDFNVIIVTSAAAHAKAADYFADGGYIEAGADEPHEESRAILHSEPVAPDKVRLVLEAPLYLNDVGDSIDMFPGYDGTIDALTALTGDNINGGMFPTVPATPPNIKAVKTKAAGGGGKGGK